MLSSRVASDLNNGRGLVAASMVNIIQLSREYKKTVVNSAVVLAVFLKDRRISDSRRIISAAPYGNYPLSLFFNYPGVIKSFSGFKFHFKIGASQPGSC
jgi:hypothetical protein